MINEHIIPKTTSIERDLLYNEAIAGQTAGPKKADKVMSIYEHGMG